MFAIEERTDDLTDSERQDQISNARAVKYVQDEMSTVLDDNYPDELERIFGELEEAGFTESEIEAVYDEMGW